MSLAAIVQLLRPKHCSARLLVERPKRFLAAPVPLRLEHPKCLAMLLFRLLPPRHFLVHFLPKHPRRYLALLVLLQLLRPRHLLERLLPKHPMHYLALALLELPMRCLEPQALLELPRHYLAAQPEHPKRYFVALVPHPTHFVALRQLRRRPKGQLARWCLIRPKYY